MCWAANWNARDAHSASKKAWLDGAPPSSVDLAGSGVPPVDTELHGAIAGPLEMFILCFIHSRPRPLRRRGPTNLSDLRGDTLCAQPETESSEHLWPVASGSDLFLSPSSARNPGSAAARCLLRNRSLPDFPLQTAPSDDLASHNTVLLWCHTTPQLAKVRLPWLTHIGRYGTKQPFDSGFRLHHRIFAHTAEIPKAKNRN